MFLHFAFLPICRGPLGFATLGMRQPGPGEFLRNNSCRLVRQPLSSRMDSREAFIALNLIEGVGPVRVRLLLDHFGDAPKILAAAKSALLRLPNIGEEVAGAIANWEKSVDLAGELKRIADFGCHVLIQSDDNYPASLREIYDPPLVLYVQGELSAKDKNAVAMVGSRQTTHYGIETARKLAYQLAYVGVTVVSGGARGLDNAGDSG